MRVLITDGNERSALAVVRALGEVGMQVVVGAETEKSLAGTSRHCTKTFQYPSPLEKPEEFVSTLAEIGRREHIDSVFPVSDLAMQLVARHRSTFVSGCALPIPPTESYEMLSDKCQLVALSKRLDVPVPTSVMVSNGQVEEVLHEIRTFPVVVKPARSLVKVGERWVKTSVRYAADRQAVHRLYADIPYLQQPSVLQERVEGEGQGIFGLFDQGEPVALFAHRRLREHPPSGGVSVLRESIALPYPMTDYAVRLLRHVRWHGVAMVEFKIERRTGMPRLIEVNGRFWGSLQLATDAGINFPHLLAEIAQGRRQVIVSRPYQVGVRSRWMLGDLDHLLIRLRRSNAELNLPPDSPSRIKCLMEFCRFLQSGLYYEVERWNDRGPAWFELRAYLAHLLKRGIRLER